MVMSEAAEESLYERVKAIAIELENRQEQADITAIEASDPETSARAAGEADGLQTAAERIRSVLDAGDTDA